MTRSLSWFAVCLTLLAACAAPAPENDEAIPPDAVIVVGDFANPPFSSWNDAGIAVGLEVEILEEVGLRLGRPIVWQERPFAEMLPATAGGEAHVAASTVGVTEERARRVRFSESYHGTEIAVIVRTGDGEPNDLAALAGRRVGAGRATTSEDAVRRSLPEVQMVLDRQDDLPFIDMLLQEKIDALVLDRPAAERLVSEHPGAVRRLEQHLGEERYAFAVNPDHTDVLEAINAVVRAYHEDGRLERWVREQGLGYE